MLHNYHTKLCLFLQYLTEDNTIEVTEVREDSPFLQNSSVIFIYFHSVWFYTSVGIASNKGPFTNNFGGIMVVFFVFLGGGGS